MKMLLVTVVIALVLASCVDRTFHVRLEGSDVATALASETKRTPWSWGHGDAFPREGQIPLSTVQGSGPVTISVESAGTVRGYIYDVESPGPSGGPLEEFEVPSGGTFESKRMQSGRLYEVLVNVSSSVLGFGGEVTRVFRVRMVGEGAEMHIRWSRT